MRRTLGALLCAVVLAAAAPALALDPAARVAGTFASFGYSETSLRTTYASADLFFPTPVDVRPSGPTTVELALDSSPLLTGESTLTVLAGGISVASARLGPGAPRALRVTVAPELVGSTGLALGLRGYLRLTDDDCEETSNPAKWVSVRGTSRLAFGVAQARRDLADTGALLTGTSTRSAVAVQADPSSPQLLEAAGVVAAQVGRFQGEAGQDALVVTDAASAGATVVVGSAAAGFPSASGARLALVQDGPQRLLVGGETPEQVLDAARALHDPRRRAALGGPVTSLADAREAALPELSAPWTDDAASFAQLGLDRQAVGGLGTREVFYRAERPPSWALREGARLDLVVDSSAALREDVSTVQVLLGGTDLGSRRLVAGGGVRTYGFDIPAGLADRRLDGRPVRNLDLTVRFVLQLPQRDCQVVDPSAATAAVLPQSAFVLPHDETRARELGRFPSPLDDAGRVSVVLPATPSAEELEAGLQMAAALGRASAVDDEAPLLTTSDALPDAARERGLVLVGDAAEELGGDLDLGGATTLADEGTARALLGYVASPFDEDRTALVLQGGGPGLVRAARALGSRLALESVRGSRVVLTDDRPLQVLAGSEAGPPPELAPVDDGGLLDERPWAVPALVVLGGFLALLVLLVRWRWWGGRRSTATPAS